MSEPGNPYNPWKQPLEADAWDRTRRTEREAWLNSLPPPDPFTTAQTQGGGGGLIAQAQDIIDNVGPITSLVKSIRDIAQCGWKPRLIFATLAAVAVAVAGGPHTTAVALAGGAVIGALFPSIVGLVLGAAVLLVILAFVILRLVVVVGLLAGLVVLKYMTWSHFNPPH